MIYTDKGLPKRVPGAALAAELDTVVGAVLDDVHAHLKTVYGDDYAWRVADGTLRPGGAA